MGVIMEDLKITYVSVHDLRPNPENPNKHAHDQIERLAKIIKKTGFRRPITVSNQSGYIVVGHGRLQGAILAGLEKVPVIYQDYENYDSEYADMVADNALDDWSFLDLGIINEKIPDLGPDLDMDMLGFKNFTLDPFEEKEPKEKELDENIETKHECPSCGYKW